MGKIALTVDTPLVNEKFEVLEASKDFRKNTRRKSQLYSNNTGKRYVNGTYSHVFCS